MGLRGPNPQPSALKLLRGNPWHRPINKNEFQPAKTPDVPEAPVYLTGYALEGWHLAPEIYHNGLLTICDITMFCCYCVAYELWRNSAEAYHRAMQGKNQDLQITLSGSLA
jgi:phage terminase small subunit